MNIHKGTYTFGCRTFDLTSRTYIMGILNVTPDSFYDGGKYYDVDSAVRRGLKMVEEEVDFIDVGGESTRPGAEPISVEEELRRVLPVIERLAKVTDVPISIDTYKSDVAERALDAGAVIVNDISGLNFDPRMIDVVARYRASVVIMHIKGTPKDMQQNPEYKSVIEEICLYFQEAIKRAKQKGIDQIIIDPGIGFGKKLIHNLTILKQLNEFRQLGYPLLVGPSRKSFIGAILDVPVGNRLEGTAAATAISIMNGANIVRVHDVKAMKRVARVVDAIMQA